MHAVPFPDQYEQPLGVFRHSFVNSLLHLAITKSTTW